MIASRLTGMYATAAAERRERMRPREIYILKHAASKMRVVVWKGGKKIKEKEKKAFLLLHAACTR